MNAVSSDASRSPWRPARSTRPPSKWTCSTTTFTCSPRKAPARAGVLYRGGPTGYRLALVAPAPADQLSPFELPVTISPQPAPCLTDEEAAERLGLLGLPFLFFIDAAEGRASVLYHRYDGHYGLITPAG